MNLHVEFNELAMKVKKKHLLHAVYTKGQLLTSDFAWLQIVDTAPIKPHHAIVTTEADGYLVSVLKQPNQNKDSYIEIMMTENHPLYSRVHNAVAILNVAGTQNEIEGVGEAFQTGVYHVVLDTEEHRLLAGV